MGFFCTYITHKCCTFPKGVEQQPSNLYTVKPRHLQRVVGKKERSLKPPCSLFGKVKLQTYDAFYDVVYVVYSATMLADSPVSVSNEETEVNGGRQDQRQHRLLAMTQQQQQCSIVANGTIRKENTWRKICYCPYAVS